MRTRKCVVCKGPIRPHKLRRLPLAARPCVHVGCLKRAVMRARVENAKEVAEVKADFRKVINAFREFDDGRGKPLLSGRSARFWGMG